MIHSHDNDAAQPQKKKTAHVMHVDYDPTWERLVIFDDQT